MADLARVRQALAMLSDEPPAAQPAAQDDNPVPTSGLAGLPALPSAEEAGDDTDTFPLPVILPGATAVPRPDPVEAPRGPFEPARPAGPAVSTEPVQSEPEPTDGLPRAAAEKLDQIKDLLLTAEAIGEANLDRHFEQVSQRQRELIREFFDRAVPSPEQET